MSDIERSAQIQSVRIIKTCVGALSFTIVNPLTGISQRMEISSGAKDRMIAIPWAACIYADISSGAYRMYKQGYFTFSDENAVYEYALEHGLVLGDVEIKSGMKSDHLQEILNALTSGNTLAIDKFLDGAKDRIDLVHVARDNYGDLKQSIISYIEKKAGVQLKEDEA